MTEVISVVDDDQFAAGQSVEKCGYEIVAMLACSGPSGAHIHYTGADIHKMASIDYVYITGLPDFVGNVQGMSLQQLYADLESHNLHYIPWPLLANLDLENSIRRGYPVILAVEESSVFDFDLQACPYAWDTTGLNHIILATGIGSRGLLCRDTASVENGKVRPGPREYDQNKLRLVSVTTVIMPWLPVPQGDSMDTILQPAGSDDLRVFTHFGIPFHASFAIEKSWLDARRQNFHFGPALEEEVSVNRAGTICHEQQFSAALASWNSSSGEVTWYGPMGIVKLPG